MITLFWLLLLTVVYCYFGYPFFLMLFSKLFSRPVDKKEFIANISIIIAVWNEADVIERKLNNFLNLDYPKERMEILIGSDGSSDQTVELIKRFKDERVRVFDFKERRGKMMVLNELVGQAKHEVLIFTDARQVFSQDALRQLVANFSDEKVGCVSGELLFFESDGATAKGVSLYWRYEKFMRKLESKIHSMLGATGAIYAIRKELYEPVPCDVVLDDMYVPLKIISRGFRAVFDDTARAYDNVADNPKEEYRRKSRTLFGNYQIFGLFKGLFNPFKSPIAVQLFSHKLLRVLAPFMLIALLIVNVFISDIYVYFLLLIGQVLFYAMALVGALARHQKHGILKVISRLCYVPYVFCLLNYSAFIGFFRFVFVKQNIAWEKARGE